MDSDLRSDSRIPSIFDGDDYHSEGTPPLRKEGGGHDHSLQIRKNLRTPRITDFFPVVAPRLQPEIHTPRITNFFPVVAPRLQPEIYTAPPTKYFPRQSFTRLRRRYFPFLELPAELRIQIYEYSLPVMIGKCRSFLHGPPVCQTLPNRACSLENSGLLFHSQKDKCYGYLALLLTCRTIYKEGLDVLYSPTRSHDKSPLTTMRLFITSGSIDLRDYTFFCREHLMYREGAAAIFSRIRYLDVTVIGAYEPIEFTMDQLPLGLDSHHQVSDNVRWVADQLQHAKHLSTLAIRTVWRKPPDISESKWLLAPFEDIRNVKNPKIFHLGSVQEQILDVGDCSTDDGLKMMDEIEPYKRKMRKLLSSNKSVKPRAIAFQDWISFKRTMKRIMGGAADINLLRDGLIAFEKDDFNEFGRVLHKFEVRWQAEMTQRMELDRMGVGVIDIKSHLGPPVPSRSPASSVITEEHEDPCWFDPDPEDPGQ